MATCVFFVAQGIHPYLRLMQESRQSAPLVSLDLGGQAEGNLAAEVTMTMGRLTLRLPKGAGVRLTLDRFFASFSPAGFSRQGEQFVTPDYSTARRKIDLRVASSVGAVKVEWY